MSRGQRGAGPSLWADLQAVAWLLAAGSSLAGLVLIYAVGVVTIAGWFLRGK